MSAAPDLAAEVRRLFCGPEWTRLLGTRPRVGTMRTAVGVARVDLMWPGLDLAVSSAGERLYRLNGFVRGRHVDESAILPEVDEESILTNAGTLIETLWPGIELPRREVA